MQTLVQEKKEISLREYIQAQSAPPVQQERMERLFSLPEKIQKECSCTLADGCGICLYLEEVAGTIWTILNGKTEDH